ncbi:kinetochore protein Mis19/Eic1 [Schizosaccharomyces pombe]|uniref:CENP-A recruiting complex protein mis19 n=2 Tax=Schizosaccharomyces pombe (strain 972 / ATCC 24843) TaxID=284812 RepID=MIS19_SCHPO|nr:uncharacterized protein SPBC27B12.02 [Schizosaccharomyces pombe]O42995.2 RecName: Full=CENP-A recruiting complex protein mis19; AltName: Full=Eighteen-interacting centromere protein 1; AltName: Full=Kinetochore protein mis19 [Schizosaccharomyces pombe 972h-]5WJC_B Chain B, Eic1 protein [Schizosaccharomyces pombe 972h-]CAB63198.2 sequence orphan [Schizosaccharomyces pombe]|eukprot:NP_595535.2 uncharacterized protein SPBC27B12.02 [Schizosaccharomyces pombe]
MDLMPLEKARAIEIAFDNVFHNTKIPDNLQQFDAILKRLERRRFIPTENQKPRVYETELLVLRFREFGVKDNHNHPINLHSLRSKSLIRAQGKKLDLHNRVFLRRNVRAVKM